ncbi:MAG: tyrosine-protein kinase family protein, partial [Candidatus Binataceae bacterium]
LFTSSNSGEGKTVTALNTAIIHAQAGAKVLLLDAELRRSTCHKLLQVDNRAGLSDVLANRITVKEAVRAIAPGLYLMSAGSPTANPGAMLGSLRMRDLLAELGKTFDYVIIDCCPVMPVSDALALCAIVDGVIFVVGAHTTPKWVARQALLRLIRAKARLLGTVLNGVDMRRSEYAYHYYRAYQPFADRQIESDYLASSHTVDPE